MRNTFLVHLKLPDVFSAEFYDLIPKQRMLINSLMEKQIVMSYSLDMERKNVWAFFQTKDEADLMDVLSSFPIIKKVKVDIHELAFYDVAPINLPDLIMN